MKAHYPDLSTTQMNIRQTILLPALAVLAVAAAPAQQRAQAELFTRLDGDMVQAVVRIEIDPGAWAGPIAWW